MTTLPATASDRPAFPAPPAPCREFDDIVRKYRGRLEDAPRPGAWNAKAIRRDLMPAPRVLAALEERAAAIRASLASDPKWALDLCATLRAGYTAYGEDRETARKIAQLFARAVESFPPWAIAAACGRFMRARTLIEWPLSKCPEPPDLVREVRAGMASVLTELNALEAILAAESYEPVSDADRERVMAMAAAFAKGADMKAASTGRPPTSEAERQAAEARLAELEGAPVSEEAA